MIVGGESGPRHVDDPQWVVDIRNDCLKKGVPFFFKQWGGVHKKEAGRELFGKTFDEMPIPRLRQNPAPLPVETDSMLNN